MTAITAEKTKAKPPYLGFGFNPSESCHHFLVTLPNKKKDDFVYVTEHLNYDEKEGRRELSFALGQEDNKVRVFLPFAKWERIAEVLKAEFNQRLKKNGVKSGRWKVGRNPVARLFGKELVLLAWAIEDTDPALISTAIRNWQGLAEEERWWLFTMTNAATGHAITGKNKGWRKAVRFALTENPISESDYARQGEEDFFHLVNEDGERKHGA